MLYRTLLNDDVPIMTELSLSVALISLLRIRVSVAQEKCLAVVTPQFEHCDDLRHSEDTPVECTQANVCKKHFRFSDIKVQPFVHILENVVISAIEMCCGSLKCRNDDHYDNETISLRNLTLSKLNSSNFIFPVLGQYSTNSVYGFHYIPILELSNGYLLTKETTSAEVLNTLIKSCANLWPLLVIIILLSVIAGFIIWIPETWFNPKEFPRMFFRGLFESFWWAFVSMTTVGYGDKSPKFFISRLWSIIWILVGITICSIFTASLTNEITSASNAPDPTMHGKTIGVLKYRTFDAYFVAKHGGRIKETKGLSEDENIREIKKMLSSGSVDGIFMDKYTYMHAYAKLKNSNPSSPAGEFFLKETYRTKVTFEGETMAYGILVREEEDYNFFEEYIWNNQIVYETCALLHLNEEDGRAEDVHDIFSTEDKDGLFFGFLYVCVGIIAGILLVGSVFEIIRTSKKASLFCGKGVEEVPS